MIWKSLALIYDVFGIKQTVKHSPHYFITHSLHIEAIRFRIMNTMKYIWYYTLIFLWKKRSLFRTNWNLFLVQKLWCHMTTKNYSLEMCSNIPLLIECLTRDPNWKSKAHGRLNNWLHAIWKFRMITWTHFHTRKRISNFTTENWSSMITKKMESSGVRNSRL